MWVTALFFERTIPVTVSVASAKDEALDRLRGVDWGVGTDPTYPDGAWAERRDYKEVVLAPGYEVPLPASTQPCRWSP